MAARKYVTLRVSKEDAEIIRAALVRDALNYTTDEAADKRLKMAEYVCQMAAYVKE